MSRQTAREGRLALPALRAVAYCGAGKTRVRFAMWPAGDNLAQFGQQCATLLSRFGIELHEHPLFRAEDFHRKIVFPVIKADPQPDIGEFLRDAVVDRVAA